MRLRPPRIAPAGGLAPQPKTTELASAALGLIALLGCSTPGPHAAVGVEEQQGGGAGMGSLPGSPAGAAGEGGEAAVPVPMPAAVPGRVRRLTRLEVQNTLADLLGSDAGDLARWLEPDNGATKFSTDAGRSVSANYVNGLSQVAVQASHQLDQAAEGAALGESCVADDESELGCVKTFTRSFSSRAWRRPVTADEVDDLVVVYLAGVNTAPPEVEPLARLKWGLEYVVRAVLQAPSFVFRTELGPSAGPEENRLTSHEIASLLSYGLIASPPDEELRAFAERSSAPTVDEITAQARRLLAAHPDRYARMADRFVREWLGIDLASPAWRKSATLYPRATPELKGALERETSAFLRDWARGSSFEQLLTSSRAFASRQNAWMYGVPDDSPLFYDGAPEFSPVDVAVGARAGVLTLPSFLGSMAREDGSSPVLRGVAVLRKLLCREPPPVPAVVPPLPPAETATTQTTRQRYAQHTSVAYCAACHGAFDAMGYAFEHYDAIGAYRDAENGLAVDSSGALLDGDAATPVADAVALARLLSQSPTAHACFVRQVYRFTSGQAESDQQVPLLASAGAKFEAGGLNVAELLLGLVLEQASLPRSSPRAESP
jgi:Protein of unknown function (DUF1588)/Protein of unknown function (DUF1592)/Protein of unknown function (DUF1595)/Protein of unknown function (DUF1587)/Protein of unknown function (DUF1585)